MTSLPHSQYVACEHVAAHTHTNTHTPYSHHAPTHHAYIQMRTPCESMPSKHTHTCANTQIPFTLTPYIYNKHTNTQCTHIHYVHRDIHQAHIPNNAHTNTDTPCIQTRCTQTHYAHTNTHTMQRHKSQTYHPHTNTHNAYTLKHTSHAHTYNLHINNNLKIGDSL